MEEIKFETVNEHRIACAINKAESKNIVIMCHGYRGSKIGPNRFFVKLARKLMAKNINSLRFDQFGSGDSEGDFLDSRFDDWVETTNLLVKQYFESGHKVALLGQSMGGSTVIVSAGKLGSQLNSLVAWVPDAETQELKIEEELVEEGGQVVSRIYWEQAHNAGIIEKLKNIKVPGLIFQAENDEYVNQDNKSAIKNNAPSNIEVVFLEGHNHSLWTFNQANSVIDKTADFFASAFS